MAAGTYAGVVSCKQFVVPLGNKLVAYSGKLCRETGNVKMDIEDLDTFVAVADTGGISAAARRLGVSKSIVSRRLFRIEAELGTQLLARTTRGAALTEAGSTFRDHAARASAEINMARETILPTGGLRGRLRIAMPLSIGPTHFAPVLAEMAHRHPHLHIQSSYSDRFVDLIAEGFDCALRVGYLPDSNMIAKRIVTIQGRLVASQDYITTHGSPETPDEVVAHEALMQGTESWQFMDDGKIVTVQPQGRFKADNAVALAAAAASGLGIAFLPDCITHDYIRSGALVPIMTRYPPPLAGAFVVRPPGLHPARKIRVLIDTLVDHCIRNPDIWGLGREDLQA